MPGGLIAWGKNRFLKRKSPERAVHVILPPEPSRHVRFNDWRDSPGRNSNTIGGPQPSSSGVARAPDWRYSDDVRVQIAPLAHQEDIEVRERRAMSAPRNQPPPMHMSNHSDYAPIAKDSFDEARNHLNDVNVVFLQRNDEVKRTMLPSDLRTLRQVQSAFCRTFNLSMGYLQQPHVRIYIQEPRGQLFYELEDPMDIRDKSVLRLKESPQCPSPSSRLDILSDADLGSSISSSIIRPGSAMAAFSPQQFGPPKPMYDPYDVYASDSASSHDSRSIPRSGTATPVIDRETRVRMDTMERQLQGLSSLVHSALKGMDETSVRDMEILRRQVLSLRSDRIPSEEPPSLPDSSLSSSREGPRESRERDLERHQQLASLKGKSIRRGRPKKTRTPPITQIVVKQAENTKKDRVQQTATEMRQLRRVAQVNAQNSREIIRTTGDQIMKILAERLGRRAESVLPSRAADARKEEYARQLSSLLEDLTHFEKNVEEVRSSVLNSNRKLRMSEVERLTTSLTDIGKAAANLKTIIPEVHGQSEEELMADVERVRIERSDATTAIDQSLRRCKALANIMVTMKKLAMVQDPSMQKTTKNIPSSPTPASSSNGTASSTPLSNGHNQQTPPSPRQAPPSSPLPQPHYHNIVNNNNIINNNQAPPPPPAPPLHKQNSINGSNGVLEPPPPVPPSPVHYTSPMNNQDGALREVNSSPIPGGPVSGPTSGPSGQPPRPPSRFSVRDARQRAPMIGGSAASSPIPMGSGLMGTGVAPLSSPIQGSVGYDADAEMRRAKLEERQALLAEKQRLLHNQFEQLQQLAPN